MYDQLEECISMRFFSLINNLPAELVVWSLGQIITWRGGPEVMEADNGP